MDTKVNICLENRENLFIIGLLGGIASGKSTVGKYFNSLGSHLINADKIVHKVLEDNEIQQKIKKIWGNEILINGQINKQKLSKIVFPKNKKNKTNLKKLEKIIHPVVFRLVNDKLQNLANEGKNKVVLDIALLWEKGLYKNCDLLIFIESELKTRQNRVVTFRNWNPEEIILREQFQVDIALKKASSDFIINNSNSKEETFEQIKNIWNLISNDKL